MILKSNGPISTIRRKKAQNRNCVKISVKNNIGIHVDYVELMAQVMKTFLEPQCHGTSKEVKILSCILKLKSMICNRHLLRIQYTQQLATHIYYHTISITKFRQHNQLHFFFFRNPFTFNLNNLWVKQPQTLPARTLH